MFLWEEPGEITCFKELGNKKHLLLNSGITLCSKTANSQICNICIMQKNPPAEPLAN